MLRILALLLTLIVSAPTLAQRPLLISYQGLLTDATGTPVPDGQLSIRFALYKQSEGGSNVWSETQSVSITSGVFDIYLGSESEIPPELFEYQLWLGVKVGTDGEMTPRTLLGVAPYAVAMYDTTTPGQIGFPCSDGLDCVSGLCADGVCCDGACDNTCEQCDSNVVGQCEPSLEGSDPDNECGAYLCNGAGSCSGACLSNDDCKSNWFCGSSFTCETKLANGSSCTSPDECIDGNCQAADGVCCRTACGGVCTTCNGTSPGECEYALAGTDPRLDCAGYYCDGSGFCQTSCFDSSECSDGYTCDGGSCVVL
jgi:hypothetical protein